MRAQISTPDAHVLRSLTKLAGVGMLTFLTLVASLAGDRTRNPELSGPARYQQSYRGSLLCEQNTDSHV